MRKDLDREATELWDNLNRKDPVMPKILMGLLSIESIFDQIFERCFTNGTTVTSDYNHFDFRTKNEILYAVGLLDKDLHSRIKSFSEVRNRYAHDMNYVLDEERINALTEGICEPSEGTEHKVEQLVANICGKLAGYRDLVSLNVTLIASIPQEAVRD